MSKIARVLVQLLVLQLSSFAVNAQQTDRVENQILDIGKSIYLDGIASNGMPVNAVLSGDVAVAAEQAACVSCHQRSGLGTSESSVISWRISGNELYQPRRRSGAWSSSQALEGTDSRNSSLPMSFDPHDDRAAYSDKTLAKAIRGGVDASGNTLNSVMPRYNLSDTDMAAVIAYLKSISAHYSPGVDETTLRFATVVSENADPVAKAAMLDVLEKHINNHNSQTRPYRKRIKSGPFYRSEMNSAYRSLALDVWLLKGEQETWVTQLQDYYDRQPVFALLGGLAEGEWTSIHQFCEQNQIPNIFPITDLPVISNNDWYTLYFSKGAYQQGEAAARYLKTLDLASPTGIVQLYSDSEQGRRYAQGFRQSLPTHFDGEFIDLVYTAPEQLNNALLGNAKGGSTVWLLWLDNEQAFTETTQWLAQQSGGSAIYLSAFDLLKSNTQQLDPPISEHLYLTYSQSLPSESRVKETRLRQWLKISGIESRNILVEDKMYFLGWMLSAVLKNMRNDFYRDYFMENFEMMREQSRAIAHYPHVSFAPGQRYISKGSYIVKHEASTNELIRVSDWSVY